MISIQNYYDFLPRSGEPAKQLVILLHGLGSNGRDLISLAPYWAKDLPDAVFVSPDAPFPCDMVPPGYPDSYQWFSLQSRDPHSMLSGAQTAAPALLDFIAAQLDRFSLKASQCALVGFSQGTMMSLYAGPRFAEKLAGILGYSGALLWDDQSGASIHKCPVHLIHGEADDVVPVTAYHMARAKLEAEKFSISGHTTPFLTHSIDEQGISSGGTFLKSIF
jgi:phospholipase/carboxylesterase